MTLFTALVVFFLGMINGAIAMTTFTIYLGHRAMKKRDKQDEPKKNSINARMKRVKEIANEQVDLAARASGPQKNSLDGKYKNSLNAQLKVLDDEKNEILKSILLDGHDPELTTVDSAGVVTNMKLSEYMAYMGISVAPKAKSAQEVKAERIGKFTVFKGGKDDGGNTTH